MRQQKLKGLVEREDLPGPYQLPKGWRWVRIRDVCDVKGGKRLPKDSTFSEKPTPYKYIRVVDFEDVTVSINGIKYISEDVRKKIKNYTISKDDVYISIAGTIGKAGIIPDELENANLTENAAKLVINNKGILNKIFLVFCLNSFYVKQQIERFTKIVGQPKLALFRIKQIQIPLPPIDVQGRIVARVEELFGKIDKIKRLRKGATEEARALMPAALHEVFSKADEKGWKWVELKQICKVFSGSPAPQDSRYFEDGEHPFVRVHDLGKFVRTDNLVDIRDKVNNLAIKNLRLIKASKGTILFPKSGAAILTNNRAILGIDAFIVSHLAAVYPEDNSVISKYIYYFLCQIDMRDYIENPAYPSLKLSKIKKIKIPTPPKELQGRIVDYFDIIQKRAAELKKAQEATEIEIDKLKEILLHKAFRGELTS